MANTLTITDNRTGKQYEFSVEHETMKAIDLRKIKVKDDDFGLMTYDPAFMNTASVKSSITFIDGDQGILQYRGYPIDQLAEHCTSFLEVAYLVFYGTLPTKSQLEHWQENIFSNSALDVTIKTLIEGFRADAHPMGVMTSMLAALSTLYPEAQNIHDPENRLRQVYRLMGQVPTMAAWTYRHSKSLPYVQPDPHLSYAGNFLNMMFNNGKSSNQVHPKLEHALAVLFVLHADHEQNCSANVMRSIGSSHTNPYAAIAGAAAALWGPLHGGANEEVLRMLDEIGSLANVPAFIAEVKEGKGKLMGFGHRVYKNYDPRAKVIKKLAYEVFEVTGRNPKLDLALALEKIALEDEYFIKRKLYPNVDFYSGLIYQAMGFPAEYFTVLFAIGRTIGWLAQWNEHMADAEQKIARPRQIYLGALNRSWIPIENRT
ncbi:MAG TPA: citrate synthase [Bacteroidota bacterium]|nr:citrate synthase [Bacteroidota bacterium]